jgi:hypothetical protein
MERSLADVFTEMFSNLMAYLFTNYHRKIEGHQHCDT